MARQYRIKLEEDGYYHPQYKWCQAWPFWSKFEQCTVPDSYKDCYVTKYFSFGRFEDAAAFLEREHQDRMKALTARKAVKSIKWTPGVMHETVSNSEG